MWIVTWHLFESLEVLRLLFSKHFWIDSEF